jgi:hypothetical protein
MVKVGRQKSEVGSRKPEDRDQRSGRIIKPQTYFAWPSCLSAAEANPELIYGYRRRLTSHASMLTSQPQPQPQPQYSPL